MLVSGYCAVFRIGPIIRRWAMLRKRLEKYFAAEAAGEHRFSRFRRVITSQYLADATPAPKPCLPRHGRGAQPGEKPGDAAVVICRPTGQ
jgi:hypothetical protein